MAKKEYSLAHTKWMCKYHIVFTPKYRRKVIYNQYKADIRDIIKQLCSYKGVEIIEGHLMPDHIHMLVSIPPKISVSSFMVSDGTLWEGQIALYFRWTCLPDCAVPELDADYRRNNRRLS